MTIDGAEPPALTITLFSTAELELISDAFGVLFFRAPERREEIMAFALTHPELDLFYPHEQSEPEDGS